MRFTPQTDEQIAAEEAKRQPLPPGVYDCEVKEAEDAVSKAGNDMIALVLRVYAPDGSYRTVRDWLVSTMAGKVKRAAYAFGLDRAYDGGNLGAHDFEGRPGRVKVRIERDATGQYPPKNVVADYPEITASNPPPSASASARKPAMVDDDIPF